VKVQWSSEAQASALRYMRDQDGMRAIIAAVDALADDPRPPTAFHAGEYHRLRTGPYRIRYVIEGDLITIERVDRVL
jgi:mRNA-degrading endonuclease RelE of RelBE toxin-antitoxin system